MEDGPTALGQAPLQAAKRHFWRAPPGGLKDFTKGVLGGGGERMAPVGDWGRERGTAMGPCGALQFSSATIRWNRLVEKARSLTEDILFIY